MPAHHPTIPEGRLGVATADEYDAAGWSRSARRHAVRRGRLVRVAAGRFAPPPSASLSTFQQADLALARRAVAGTIQGDRVAAGLLAAAWMQGCPIWAQTPRTCVATWDPRVRQLAGLHLHHMADGASVVRRLDVPMTSMATTLVGIACEFGTESALVSGDFALRHGLVNLRALTATIDAFRGHTGIDRARLLPALLDPLAESPLESRGRWHIRKHGLTVPYSQVLIHALDGRFLGRVDHYWADGVVGEADGLLKYDDDPKALALEKGRQQGLEDVDIEVARWGSRDFLDFTAASGRITRAHVRRRQRVAAGETPRWIATTLAGVRIPVTGRG